MAHNKSAAEYKKAFQRELKMARKFERLIKKSVHGGCCPAKQLPEQQAIKFDYRFDHD